MLNLEKMNVHVYSRSDLFVAGRDEDGANVEGEVYYVVAELPNGARFAHDRAFPSIRQEEPNLEGLSEEEIEWAPPFIWKQLPAETQVEQLVDRIKSAGEVDIDKHWHRIEPCYGTAAWLEWDQDMQADHGDDYLYQ